MSNLNPRSARKRSEIFKRLCSLCRYTHPSGVLSKSVARPRAHGDRPFAVRRWANDKLAACPTFGRNAVWRLSRRLPAEDFACGRLRAKRPGVFETGTFLAKRAGLPCLLRGTSCHLPDCAESRELESRRIGRGRSLKVRKAPRENRTVRKSPHGLFRCGNVRTAAAYQKMAGHSRGKRRLLRCKASCRSDLRKFGQKNGGAFPSFPSSRLGTRFLEALLRVTRLAVLRGLLAGPAPAKRELRGSARSQAGAWERGMASWHGSLPYAGKNGRVRSGCHFGFFWRGPQKSPALRGIASTEGRRSLQRVVAS